MQSASALARFRTTYDPTTGYAYLEWPAQSGRLPIPSYRGYDYVGSILASQGYIVVSISANGISANDALYRFHRYASAKAKPLSDREMDRIIYGG